MRKWTISVAIAFSFLAVVPAGAQKEVAPTASAPASDWQFSHIGGNKITWSCKGTGQPTVVLVAGLGLPARDSFGRIYQNYDGSGRLCMYDRAGIGSSTFTDPKTRTLDQLVGELNELSRMNKWGDVVLVSHSFGGFIARAYEQKHPSEVLGMLFVDVAQED